MCSVQMAIERVHELLQPSNRKQRREELVVGRLTFLFVDMLSKWELQLNKRKLCSKQEDLKKAFETSVNATENVVELEEAVVLPPPGTRVKVRPEKPMSVAKLKSLLAKQTTATIKLSDDPRAFARFSPRE